MTDLNLPPEPVAEPTVEELLLARLDGYVRLFNEELDLLGRIVDQLDHDKRESCLGAIGMCRIAVEEIVLRARGQ
jgi:hypothetical protein